MKKLTTEEFITKARKVHGDKYDYSKVKYVDSQTPVCIICPEHGEFLQKPYSHLQGVGCADCFGNARLNTEKFIARAREVHGDKYDYSKVKYVNYNTKVCIVCPEHGEFSQKPSDHLTGYGCSKCAGNYKLTTEEFITRAREVHGDKYDYSKVEYKGNKTPVRIICPEHGEFEQTPIAHLRGQGCNNCYRPTRKYKFNLLQEFKNEFALREFLETNDVNIIYIILRNIEPKYEPIKADIIKAVAGATDDTPIRVLEKMYKSNKSTDEYTCQETEPEDPIDLDDVNAADIVKSNKHTLSPKDIAEYRQRELEVIGRIEHMLTPEDRKYIMDKFFNDQMREYIDSNK